MQQNKKVFVFGTDKIGWSIDKDRMYTIKAIEKIEGFELTDSYFNADIIYVVWWNELLRIKFRFLNLFFKKKIIACITNDLTHQEDELQKVLNYVDLFVYANSQQKEKLKKYKVAGNKLFFNPFYVDETLFKPLKISKQELCDRFSVEYQLLKGKYLVGSFQRDSLGNDLSQQKWQKNPETLIEIMKQVDTSNIVLVIAGPRRHYLIHRCREEKIPYLFIGDESYIEKMEDDLLLNALSIEDMPYLYNLIDLYIVSSKSEGGPKAIPEAVLCGTDIISTDVGFARDLLDERLIYKDVKQAVETIGELGQQKSLFENQVQNYYGFSFFQQRIETILKSL
ncbi:MAG TPA: glycosyltransferase [Arcobacter sp.]|nr:glycosyltransferase [Arcobacter sp.]